MNGSLISIAMAFLAAVAGIVMPLDSEGTQLGKFSSSEELTLYLMTHEPEVNNYYVEDIVMVAGSITSAPMALEAKGSDDYSRTNVQVQGVDEADIVKTDGKYLYVVSGNSIVIMDAYPAEDAKMLSEIEFDNSPGEFYINEDKLVVFQNNYHETEIMIYDVSDRENPEFDEEIEAEGRYFNSRMIGEHVYVVVNQPVYYEFGVVDAPKVSFEDEFEVYYFNETYGSYAFTTILSIDLEDKEHESNIYLTDSAQNMYVSSDNIYITSSRYVRPVYTLEERWVGDVPPISEETTIVHKISMDEGEIEYIGSGEVPGRVLNQFSMDEHEGNFRIATTLGHVSRNGGGSSNNVYVLDEKLDVVGELEDLAPGERIYSARFMGDRCYLVTFKKVDPLFVIDLENPENPEVLGKLKIPGYSDYLHPYDENHIIGIGKETVEAEEGDFAWYQGVKLSLFDVSDVEHPKEVSKYEIGDRGTDSYALRDHKAFLFDREKNLLVVPILLAEIDHEKYPEGVRDSMGGEYVWQGAYVFSVSDEEGFELRGGITHIDDDESFLKSGYYYHSPYSVKRSLYIDDVLYTVSEKKVKMNDLDDLGDIKEMELPYEEVDYYGSYE